ncbi:MAG: pre-16S rRNA-processing nuclease YqgF [Candidatus Margulisiibacteriota bacterium]|jgi:RNase H-fold protein (predicted Holliday junction resolvase)
MIVAIDPGKDKCGLAVMANDGAVKERRVVPRGEIVEAVIAAYRKDAPFAVVIGKSANGKALQKELTLKGIVTTAVPEKNTTREARARYWLENPPRGFWRLVPVSLRFPPVPVDDFAAVIIGERYLAKA